MVYYRHFDNKLDPRNKKGFIPTNEIDLHEYNKIGYGIFWTVNDFKSEVRQASNLLKVTRWAVDIDGGNKKLQRDLLKRGLVPSLVVETKSGYQAYWDAIDGSIKNWKAIVWHRLVNFYGADNNAKDICRVLRVPGYYHMKDPSQPFKVRTVFKSDCKYSESDMIRFYKPPDIKKLDKKNKQEFIKIYGSTIWEKISNINCIDGLTLLSGTEYVNYEKFSFKENSNGNFNILVNEESTSCFIDKKGLIGSMDNGGPTIFQWINWYQQDKIKTMEIMKKIFPKIFKK